MDVTMTHEEAAGLLGAWALDACEDAEAASVERHLASCADCRVEAASLTRAAAGLGELAAGASARGDGGVLRLSLSASSAGC